MFRKLPIPIPTFVVAATLLVFQSAHAQVTSIYLSHHGGSPISTHTEGAQELPFDVVTPQLTVPLTVDYRIVAGTASDGTDFVASSGTLTFDNSARIKTLKVQLLDDADFEGNESFRIELFNPVPVTPISSPQTTILIVDDETGYAPEWVATAKENDGFFEIPIYRRGDIDFPSSVEAYLEPETALPGVDYLDEIFTVNFAANESVKNIRVALINNHVEDTFTSHFLPRGARWFRVALRNPTGGIPLGTARSAELVIEDNELGYAFRAPQNGSDLRLYEGASLPLILERRGDYNAASTAIVKATPLGTDFFEWWLTPSADAEIDFQGSELLVQFAPGQTAAEVPLVVVNDSIPESTEWIRLQFSTNLTDAGLGERRLSIRDNEFNPLPVTPICLGFDLLPLVTPLRDGKFLAVRGDEMDGFNYEILRFLVSGELDPDFTPVVPNGRPTKIVEGADGKFTVRVWRNGDEGLQRFEADGRPDTLFQPLAQQFVYDFEVDSSGRVYVTNPFRRLKNDGSVDEAFASQDFRGDNIILDPAGNIYVAGDFIWHRLKPANGEIDPAFSALSSTDALYELDGVLFRYDSAGIRRITETGAPDPSFTPITNGYVHPGPNGKLYSFRIVGSEVFVDRHHSDGTLDTGYMRGTLDIPEHLINVPMLRDATGLLLYNSFGARSINGAPMYCDETIKAIARIDLDIQPQRIIVEPAGNSLPERPTGEALSLAFVRTGDNSSPETIRYRVRPGSARPGEHYTTELEGELLLPSGISRALVPINIVNNQIAEPNPYFFVDFLNPDLSVASTAQLAIQNDDVGLQVLSRNGATWRILPIPAGYAYITLERSSDLKTWETLYVPRDHPSDVEMSGPMRFLRSRAYNPF
jgi:hypothetical protein